jgi:hypothetical protein
VTNVFSVDVEDYFQVDAFIDVAGSGGGPDVGVA